MRQKECFEKNITLKQKPSNILRKTRIRKQLYLQKVNSKERDSPLKTQAPMEIS